jgi:hypothetical protein
LASTDRFAFALRDQDTGFLQQSLHVLCPRVPVGFHDEGQLAQQMRATESMTTVFIGEIGVTCRAIFGPVET